MPDRGQVIRQSLWIGIATGTYGVSFGALGVAAGLSVLQTQLLSLLMFTGGSQFALVTVLGAGGTGVAAAATATLLGVRNGLYALQVSRLLGSPRGLRRLAAAQMTIDESTAVGIAQPDTRLGRLGFWLTGLSVFVFWNAMTLAGAIAGDQFGDPKRYGLDAAAAAAFCGLIWPRLAGLSENLITALIAIVLALVALPFTPAGVPVLIAATAAIVIGASGTRPLAPAPGHLTGEDPTP